MKNIANMNIHFTVDLEDLQKGIEILQSRLQFQIGFGGIEVEVGRMDGAGLKIACSGGKGTIVYGEKIDFFRALGLFIQEARERGSFEIAEDRQFATTGAMFDVSNNAIMTVESIERMIEIMAVMGLNMFMLYSQDTYEVKAEPYFGYMRGRYSYDELKRCDDYADVFGIEIIPCIQTLAHLEKFLRWRVTEPIRDTGSILLPGDDATYQMIDHMIASASAPFRSKRIHVGMDEAYEVGLGRYLMINGYRDRFEVMNNHLKKVEEITAKYGLKPMIWSDMYFRLGSKNPHVEYDSETAISAETIEKIPRDVQFVYWDYSNHKDSFHQSCIQIHKNLGKTPIFAGGIWTWESMGINYGLTFASTNSALRVCKQEGISDVFATLWGGGDNNFFAAMLGLQLYAEHAYSRELDMSKLEKRVKFCTGVDMDAFMDLKDLDETPGALKDNLDSANPSKCLLWQDLMLGLFDKHIEGLDISGHYEQLEVKLRAHQNRFRDWDFLFKAPADLCAVLKIKGDMGLRMKQAYDRGDKEQLERIAGVELPELIDKIKQFMESHREIWFRIYKPIGWEVMDSRYGGLIQRAKTTIIRLESYLQGKVDSLVELEQERLYFDNPEPRYNTLMFSHHYIKIFTANNALL